MATETPVKFDGTKKREKGGNTALAETAEKHESSRDLGTRNGQSYAISKCVTTAPSALDDSAVTGTKKREIGPAEAIRRKNNHFRDSRVNLGTGKPSEVVVG